MNKKRFEYYRRFTGVVSIFTCLTLLFIAFTSDDLQRTLALCTFVSTAGIAVASFLIKRVEAYYALYILSTICFVLYSGWGNPSLSTFLLFSVLILCLGFAAHHILTSALQCLLWLGCTISMIEFAIPLCIASIGVGVADYIVDTTFANHIELVNKYKRAAHTDILTGCYNRLHLEAALSELPQEYSIVLVDIDYFKQCNDTFGHAYGDKVLQDVSAHLMKVFGDDNVCRYGGEEFLILLSNTSKDTICELTEQCRQTMFDAAKVHISAGIACSLPNEKPSAVIERADSYLYEAKENGRNRTVCKENL